MTPSALRTALAKFAVKKKTDVEGYDRVVDGEVQHVDPHERTVETTAPVVPVTDEKTLELRARQAKGLALWRAWDEGGRTPEDLRPLLKNFEPFLKSQSAMYRNVVRISPVAIDHEYRKQALNAFRHYDPEKGALGTFVGNYLKKAKRFIGKHQNVARIPENRLYKIREYDQAVREMEESLGRPAHDEELSGYLGWKSAEVVRMGKERHRDLWSHGFDETKGGDPSQIVAGRDEEVLTFVRYELSDEEKSVYDLYVGGGVKSTSEIGRRLGMEDFKVSRLKAAIAKKIQKYDTP